MLSPSGTLSAASASRPLRLLTPACAKPLNSPSRGYSQGALRLEAWASNLTNEQASQKAIIGANVNVRFLNDARRYGVRGRYSF